MISKHIQHLIIVALKHFFDIDKVMLGHICVVIILAFSCTHFMFYIIAEEFKNGILTIKHDVTNAKQEINEFKESLPAKNILELMFVYA